MSEQRRAQLIDQKYTTGLTASEQMELNRLTTEANARDAAVYQPVIDALQKGIADGRRDLLNSLLVGTGKVVEIAPAENGIGESYRIKGKMPGVKGEVWIGFAYVWANHSIEKLISEMCFAGDLNLIEIRKKYAKAEKPV